MNNKVCVVFIRNDMQVGGIETYIYESCKNIVIDHDDIVVWVAKNFKNVGDQYAEFMLSSKIQRCTKSNLIHKIMEISRANKNIAVKIVSFNPYDFCKAEEIKNKLKEINIDTFLFIPHFCGEFLYLEENFKFNKKISTILGMIYKRMEYNQNIRYFSARHLFEFRKRYGCKEECFSKVKVPEKQHKDRFDINRVERVFNQDDFIILAPSRLEFPHKGYILGLVDVFSDLCNSYDNLKLVIVGDGKDRPILTAKIDTLKERVQSKIFLTGAVSPEKLDYYYNIANVNVSLAGCFVRGASKGVLSLIVRHYTNECQVYGYLPNSKKFILSEKEGENIMPFLEEIINMDFNQYLKKSIDCYNTYNSEQGTDEYYYFDKISNKTNNVIKTKQRIFIKLLAVYSKLKSITK